MAHGLRIVSNTTVDLNAPPATALAEYTPRTPETQSINADNSLRDGGEIPLVTRRNVTETAVIFVDNLTPAGISAIVQSLEAMMLQAERRQKRQKGQRVYVEFQPHGSGEWWRSELLTGRVELGENTLAALWWQGRAFINISWTRRFYWERSTEVAVPLSNSSGSNVTAGLTVSNHSDGGHENFVNIDGDDIDGVMPAPMRLELTNTYNNASRAYNIYVVQNVNSNPLTFPHILEAEAATTGGTTVANVAYSNGSAKTLSWAGSAETELLRWTLSSSLLQLAAGNTFRMLAFLPTISFPTWVKWRVKFELTTIYESAEVLVDTLFGIQDWGVLRLPPYMVDASNPYPLTLHLYGRAPAGSGGMTLDFLQLSSTDGYRLLAPRGYGMQYTQRVVDDGMLGVVSSDFGVGGQEMGYYLGYGEMLLQPGQDQRLSFLANNSTGGVTIDRTLSVKAFYRPRRLTV